MDEEEDLAVRGRRASVQLNPSTRRGVDDFDPRTRRDLVRRISASAVGHDHFGPGLNEVWKLRRQSLGVV